MKELENENNAADGSVESSDLLAVLPLTDKETRWIKQASDLFAKAPDRFEFFASGDAVLSIIDRASAVHSEIADGAADRDGIVLGRIKTKHNFHAVRG